MTHYYLVRLTLDQRIGSSLSCWLPSNNSFSFSNKSFRIDHFRLINMPEPFNIKLSWRNGSDVDVDVRQRDGMGAVSILFSKMSFAKFVKFESSFLSTLHIDRHTHETYTACDYLHRLLLLARRLTRFFPFRRLSTPFYSFLFDSYRSLALSNHSTPSFTSTPALLRRIF